MAFKEKIKWAIEEPGYACRRTMQILRALFFKRERFPLKDIVLFLTFNCNLRCVMCPLWGEEAPTVSYDGKLTRRMLPLEMLKSLVDQASGFLPTFLFSGGEPLMYPKWRELAEHIQRKSLHCNLQSNGHYLGRFAREVSSLFHFVNVSIDGLQRHDQIRGQKGSFDTIISGLEKLQMEKERQRKKRPYLNICVTIGPENMDEIEDLLDFLEKQRLTIASVVLMQREFNEKTPYNRQTAEALADHFAGLRRKRTTFPLIFRPDEDREGVLRYLLDPGSYLKRKFRACPHPYYEIFVHPDGSVWTCPSTQVGNLYDEPFALIWKRVREKAFEESLFESLSLCRHCKGEVYMYGEGAQRMRQNFQRSGGVLIHAE